MKIFKQLLVLTTVSCLITNTVIAQNFTKDEVKNIKKFFKAATAMYSNKVQAEAVNDPTLGLSESRFFPIMKHKKQEYWMSIGWYLPGEPDKPLVEKILHANKNEDGQIYFDVYSFPKDFEDRKFLEWKKKDPYADLDPIEDLTQDGCKLILTFDEKKKIYLLKAEEENPCSVYAPLAPFDKIWFHFEFGATRMTVYNKHYTPEGKLFIDYKDKPFLMDKIKYNPKTF